MSSNNNTHKMKNETIKTYTEITPLEALKMLVENDGEPVEFIWMSSCPTLGYYRTELSGVDLTSTKPFLNGIGSNSGHCFTCTEIDPCKAPDGCPELEPWMAYVGIMPNADGGIEGMNFFCAGETRWLRGYCGDSGCHYAIDVRTEWAQKHFPEHCRIRNYQEPDPFKEWLKDAFCKSHLNLDATYCANGAMLKSLYELGQANPTK